MEPTPWTAGRILETASAYWQVCTLHTGVKLEIFTFLEGKTATAATVAEEIKADAYGTEVLLNALAAMGLIVKSTAGYTDTDAAVKWLSKKSNQYLGHIILHQHHLVETWDRLDEVVRTGAPPRIGSRHNEAERRENFLMGMFNMAMNLAPYLSSEIDLSGRAHLLDLGGGPGTWAIHFCLKNPTLKATIFDLPTTRPFAQKTIERFGLTSRINFATGNFLEDPIPGSYDAAWLSQILHGEGPEDCLKIIQKTVSALKPGGLIMIHEFLLNDPMDGPLFPALFSLNMLGQTEKGRSYSQGQLEAMLRATGVIDIRRIEVVTPNDSAILSGVKSATPPKP
ncbi:MAG: methyltransferase [Pseudomonadota bacterium]